MDLKLEHSKLEHTRVFQFNERSILIQMDSSINPKTLDFILNLKAKIRLKTEEPLLQVINTYNSLLVIFKYSISDFNANKNKILELISNLEDKPTTQKVTKKIPVCYDEDFGYDLKELSEDLGLSISEIISRHSETIYTVYFIGFMPGFPYLGGLDSSLFHRRKSQPRAQIPAGSVGIADQQTGIYPVESPGGWQIIGRSPIRLFDSNNSEQMCYLKAGDKIQFEIISKKEFEKIQS